MGKISISLLYSYQEEGRINSRQNLNEYLETLYPAPTQFCDLPGFYCKILFLRSPPLSLVISLFSSN